MCCLAAYSQVVTEDEGMLQYGYPANVIQYEYLLAACFDPLEDGLVVVENYKDIIAGLQCGECGSAVIASVDEGARTPAPANVRHGSRCKPPCGTAHLGARALLAVCTLGCIGYLLHATCNAQPATKKQCASLHHTMQCAMCCASTTCCTRRATRSSCL
jgi:hypothetical protein